MVIGWDGESVTAVSQLQLFNRLETEDSKLIRGFKSGYCGCWWSLRAGGHIKPWSNKYLKYFTSAYNHMGENKSEYC